MKSLFSIIFLLYFSLFLSCTHTSHLKHIDREQKTTSEIPNRIIINVVHINQKDTKSCATTAVAMAISYYEGLNENPLDKETVWNLSGTKEKTVHTFGNDMAGLARIAEHYGYKSEYTQYLSIHDLEYLLSQGILTVINVKADKWGLRTHAMLITGYDRKAGIFYINDSSASQPINQISYSELKFRWTAFLSSPFGISHGYRCWRTPFPAAWKVCPIFTGWPLSVHASWG